VGDLTEILVAEPETYSKKCIDVLSKVGKVTAKKMGRKELLSSIEKFDVLVIRLETRVDKELIERAKKLKVIGVAATGLDHVDVEHAKEKGLLVVSLKGERKFLESVNATVEHTFALILSLVRKIPWTFEEVKRERWTREQFFGQELNGKTMGILGLGRLGSKIAKIARSFGMRVIASDPYVSRTVAEKLGVGKVGIETLLTKSNVIVVCAALTPETKDLIDSEEFMRMSLKPILINTSRGKIVNEKALLEALKMGRIAGAALDVLSNEVEAENPLQKNPLVKYARSHDNLIITPHLGGATFESMERTGIFIAERIKSLAMKVT
jgi:D-3-phosphoglycerate dehydrogenase